MAPSKKPEGVVQKHSAALAGTAFVRCACCAGASPRLTDGRMPCSRAGSAPVFITEEQAKSCNGDNPLAVHKPVPRLSIVAFIREKMMMSAR